MIAVNLDITPEERILLDTLDMARQQANSLDSHASESHGTYGAVKTATLRALSIILGEHNPNTFDSDCTKAALAIYDAALESGESVTHTIDWFTANRSLVVIDAA